MFTLFSATLKRILPVFIILSLIHAPVAKAATTPALGAAATYAVLASTYTNTSAETTINGDIGFTTGPAVAPGGAHTNYGPVDPYALAGADQNSALSSLVSQPCTFSFPAGAIDLSTDTAHGTIGVYGPGVYCSAGAMNIGGSLTLNGNGTYIFRSSEALTSTAGASITVSGASACDVFWTPSQATTLAANTTFVGTVIDAAGITVGANVTWTGRALAFGGTVTTDSDIITAMSCAALSSVSSSISSLPVSSDSLSSSPSSSVTASSVSSSQTSSSDQSSSSVSLSVRRRSVRSSDESSVPAVVLIEDSTSSSQTSSSDQSSSSVSLSVRRRSVRSSDESSVPAVVLIEDSTPPPDPTPDQQIMPITGADLHVDLIASFLILALALASTHFSRRLV